ncbi:MAG: Lar family restriction alleviation protein [Sphaerochaeta sp.]|jgi:Lar family restriction alleviation protein|nr:Lar family restriction alleviation protein [Sphaerochaeta sp.]
MDELKRCPFCGNVAVLQPEQIGDSIRGLFFRVACTICGGMVELYETPSEAIDTWNARVDKCKTCGLALSHDWSKPQPEGVITSSS